MVLCVQCKLVQFEHLCSAVWEFSLSLFSDVFMKGAWSQLQEFEDPELQELSKCLPHIVMRGKAPATTKKYTGAFLRWKRWASQKKGIDVVPVNPFHLGYLIQKSASVAPVEEAVRALSWVHTMALEVNPTEHELVQQVLAGAKHILAKATTKKGANYCEHPAILGG